MRDGAEILIEGPMSRRGERMLQAMVDAAPAGSVATKTYRGEHRTLMLYGVGHESRDRARRQHLKRGGRVVMWDLGYWDRDDGLRLAIDSIHPTADQLALAPQGDRRPPAVLREDADPAGHILLVGLGRKSLPLYGLRALEWERRALSRLKTEFPSRRIVHRLKGGRGPRLPGTKECAAESIEDALRGCALVVCRHSNVGVDACIAGVPVRCDDGAAAALYSRGSTPTPADRAEFLRRLSWWNWRLHEAAEAWDWIGKVTNA